MSESERIHDAIQEGHGAVRDALTIVQQRMYDTDDDDERRELHKAARALQDALVSLGEARHRSNLQKQLAEPVVPWMPIPYPYPYTPLPYPDSGPWVVKPTPITSGVITVTDRTIATNGVDA